MSTLIVSRIRGLSNGDGSNGRPFATIQAAIDAAARNDLIKVEDGDYAEALFINKPLIIEAVSLLEGRLDRAGVFRSLIRGGVRITPPSLLSNFSRDNIMPNKTNAVVSPHGSIGILIFMESAATAGAVILKGLRVFGSTNAIRAGGVHVSNLANKQTDEKDTQWPSFGRLVTIACKFELLDTDKVSCIDPNTQERRRFNCGTAAIRCDLKDCEVKSCVISNADIGIYHLGNNRFQMSDCSLHNVRQGYRAPRATSVFWQGNIFNSDDTAVDSFATVGTKNASITANNNLYGGQVRDGLVKLGLENEDDQDVYVALNQWQGSNGGTRDPDSIRNDSAKFVKAFRTPTVAIGLPLPNFVYFYNSFDSTGTPPVMAGRGPGDTVLPFGGWEPFGHQALSDGFVARSDGTAGQALGERGGVSGNGATFVARSPTLTDCGGWPSIAGATSVATAAWVRGFTQASTFDVGPHFYYIGFGPRGESPSPGFVKMEAARFSLFGHLRLALRLHIDITESIFWNGDTCPAPVTPECFGSEGLTSLLDKGPLGGNTWEFWVTYFRYVTAVESKTGTAGWEAYWSRNGGPLIQATDTGGPEVLNTSSGFTSIQSGCKQWNLTTPGGPGVVIESPSDIVARGGPLVDEAIYWVNAPLGSFTPELINQMYQLGLQGRQLTQFSEDGLAITIEWFGFGANEYALTPLTGSWEDMRAFAQTQGDGADLVVIDNDSGGASLNDFLVATFGNRSYWIGAHRVEGTMIWGRTAIDVSAGFDNWNSGQPAASPLDFAFINQPSIAVGKWFTSGEPDDNASEGALTGIMCRPIA